MIFPPTKRSSISAKNTRKKNGFLVYKILIATRHTGFYNKTCVYDILIFALDASNKARER